MQNTIIDKKYKVLQELGCGGSSTVYLVLDSEGNQLALKLLNRKIRDKKIQRLKNEFRLMRSLRHPNIAKVYDFGFDEVLNYYYFTLEYMSEGNFYCFNKRENREAVLLKSFYQLLCGLSYLHANNFIHYDITPNNVLITRDEKGEFVVKITDFGLTEQFEPKDTRFAGTLNFMSPEMIQGKKGLDQRTDLFSAGLILLNYLIDSDCYLPTSTLEVYIKKRLEFDNRIIREKINQVEDFRFKLVLSRLLEIDPAARSGSADEVITLLNNSFQTNFQLPVQKETAINYSDYSLFRKNELEEIITLFSATKINKNYFVVVSGEKGSGKGRLLEEFKLYNQLNNTRFYHVTFEENATESFSGMKNLIKTMLFINYDRQLDNFTPLSELVFNQNLTNLSDVEKEAVFKQIISLSNMSLDKQKIVLVVDNFEYAERDTLLFINYFLKNSYQNTQMFLVFFVNQRLIKENADEFNKIFDMPDSLVKINLPELDIIQIKEVVNCFFNNISDIPDNLYYEMQKLTGTNISRLIKLLKFLYEEFVIVKTLKGYSFSHYYNFDEIVKKFIQQTIDFNEKKLSKVQLILLYSLSLATVGLTLKELSEISNLPIKETENTLNSLYDHYIFRHSPENNDTYTIIDPVIKRIIHDNLAWEERKLLHRKIANAVRVNKDETYKYKRLRYLWHFLFSMNYNDTKFPDFKLSILKRYFYKDGYFDAFLGFCKQLVNENPMMNNNSKFYLLSEVAIGSIENKCRLDYRDNVHTFLKECKNNSNFIEDRELNFRYLAVGLLYNADGLLPKEPVEFLYELSEYLNCDYETKIRTMNIFLQAYENIFINSNKLPCIDKLLSALKNDTRLEAEYYFVRIISIFYTKASIFNSDNGFVEDFIFEIRKYFVKIKSMNNQDLVDRSYRILSGFYKSCDYDDAILDFFREAEHYFKERRQHDSLFSLKTDLVTFLEKNRLYTMALAETNSALLQIEKFQDLEKLSELVKKRVHFKYVLEELAGDVASDYNLLLEFLHKQKSETAEIYEDLINFYLDVGNYKEVFEVLHRYLKSMNREVNLSDRSKEFYLNILLNYYNVSQLRNLSNTLLADLNWSDDDFLEQSIDIKTNKKQENINLNRHNTLSNTLIKEVLAQFYKTEKKDYSDLFLQITENYDHQAILYKRAKLVLKFLNKSYKQETVEELIRDLNALYGKGYYNIAKNLAVETAKVLFYIHRDEKNFLVFTELAFKISGDLYYMTDLECRGLIKDENFYLLNDLVKDIKNRYKKK